ncbi:MAG: hypothetical protein ACE5K0_12715 [Candidatus Methanofastidiosia archaeon]
MRKPSNSTIDSQILYRGRSYLEELVRRSIERMVQSLKFEVSIFFEVELQSVEDDGESWNLKYLLLTTLYSENFKTHLEIKTSRKDGSILKSSKIRVEKGMKVWTSIIFFRLFMREIKKSLEVLKLLDKNYKLFLKKVKKISPKLEKRKLVIEIYELKRFYEKGQFGILHETLNHIKGLRDEFNVQILQAPREPLKKRCIATFLLLEGYLSKLNSASNFLDAINAHFNTYILSLEHGTIEDKKKFQDTTQINLKRASKEFKKASSISKKMISEVKKLLKGYERFFKDTLSQRTSLSLRGILPNLRR